MKKSAYQQRQKYLIHNRAQRQLIFVLLGIFLLSAAGMLIRDRLRVQPKLTPHAKPYTYSITQGVTATPQYRQNSFYGPTPDLSNTAFLSSLTNTIDAHFHYSFHASQATNLTYSYQTTATIRALYGSNDTTGSSQAPVWSKQFTLQTPATGSKTGSSLTIDPVLSIPFATYYQQMEQFRNAFSAPLNSEMIVTNTVSVHGNVHGTPISETKTSSISAPLDQQVYKLNTKYEKISNGEVQLASSKGLQSVLAALEIPIAILLAIGGVLYTVYGSRKQLIKTPYQRELEKIYRYHDGIIIRAKRPPELANKNVVTITSFDDMLNLEEELKTPIIASKVSEFTTHFFITQNDIAYVFTLGAPVAFDTTTPSN